MRFVFITLSVMIFCLGFMLGNAVTIIPKDTLTQNRLCLLEKHIRDYYIRNNCFPSGLNDLITNGDNVDIFDAWGNPIEYKINNNTNAVLISHGNPLPGIVYVISKEIRYDNSRR